MRLTLLRAKEALRRRAPEDQLEYRINRVQERVLTSGKYAGTLKRLALTAKFGQLTLPPMYRSIDGVQFDSINMLIANQWYETLPTRYPCSCSNYSMRMIRDLGDGHATIYELPAGDNILLATTPSSPNPVVTIYGTDANALPISATLTGDGASIANTFATISRIHKEQVSQSVRVYHKAADLTETNLAIMSGTEEESYYRRYIHDGYTSVDSTTVVALAKLRHIEFTSDQDVLAISNIGALEAGMDALQYEAEDDVTLAAQYWNTCIDILNRELADTDGGDMLPTIRIIDPSPARLRHSM